ncbi:MAG: cupin domain-containing protein [Candidatus Omnitrophica bacterium]|nr:cupin domain-containing protein [Candidatus Omnitrophota bacterium]
MADSKKVRLVKLDSKEKYQRLFSKDSGTCGMKSGHVVLQSGENVGEHTTGEREEAIVILKGKGEAVINKKDIFDIEKDIVLYIAPEMVHDIKNTGFEILEYIFITSLI